MSDQSAGRIQLNKGGPMIMSDDGTFENVTSTDEVSLPISETLAHIANPLEIGTSTDLAMSTDDGMMIAQFFGGAITSKVPISFEDVSVVRQVPDHQEVYVDRESEMSLIVELLNYEENVGDESCAMYYFEDLAKCNEAQNSTVDRNEISKSGNNLLALNHPCVSCTLLGRQTVTKLNQESGTTADIVQIMLLVIRLPEVTTDMLVSLNIPIGKKLKKDDKNLSTSSDDIVEKANRIMESILGSIKIVNWALFA